MLVKKFKNGKIKFQVEKMDILKDGSIEENVYYDDMFMSDLSFNQINGHMYLVDYNSQLVYDFSECDMFNPLKHLLNELEREGKIYLYSCSRKESKSLLQDLENGF